MEAQVLNKDAAFMRVGQPVTVKLDAFPFTRSGTLKCTPVWLSRDAVADEKLGPHHTARIAVTPPDPNNATAPNAGIRVSPGLTATAEIKTDTRRVIDCLLSPLERRVSEAGSER